MSNNKKHMTFALNENAINSIPLYLRTSPIKKKHSKIFTFLFQDVSELPLTNKLKNLFFVTLFILSSSTVALVFCTLFYIICNERIH